MSRKLTQHEVVERIHLIHGDVLDTSRVVYVDSSKKIEVGCRNCGRWWWSYYTNVVGKCAGCSRCGHLSNDVEFIKKAKEIHGEKYTYLSEYVDTLQATDIWCSCCEDIFKQKPAVHLQGKGCPKCNRPGFKPFTVEQLIGFATKIHGNELDFSNATQNGIEMKALVKCSKCSFEFRKSWKNLIHGKQGCPHCASVRFASLKEIIWLDTIGIPDDPQYRQVRIGRYKLDGLLDGVAYEFNGTFWHGDPRVYERDFINVKNRLTMGFLYDRTLRKQAKLESLGYTVKFLWELDGDSGLLFSPDHPTYA